MSPTPKDDDDPRLAEMLEVIFRFAAGDLKARGTLSDSDSSLDGVMAGINILGEELEAYVAEKDQSNSSLRQALEFAEALLRSSPDGILAVDRDLRITEWNPRIERMSGMTMEQVCGRALVEIPFLEETGEAARIREVLVEHEGLGENSVEAKEIAYEIPGAGDARFFESIIAPLVGPAGQIEGAVLRVRDVTVRKRAEEELRSAGLYARSLIEATLDPLVTISPEGKITDVNEAASRATGVARELLVGSDFSVYFTDPGKAAAGYQEAFTSGYVVDYPLTMRHASGKTTEVLYNASLYYEQNGEVAGVLVAAHDVTERRRAERAEELASRDGLTGLYNHHSFYALLNDELVRAQRYDHPVSLLMLDLDHFKHVNDTYGHQTGDTVLQNLSGLMVERARAVDSVCRYGGEEFAVILPETGASQAVEIGERLRAEVERQPVDLGDGRTVGISVSVGAATYPQHADSLGGLVEAADIALYAAKRGGRNRTKCYEPKMAGRDPSD